MTHEEHKRFHEDETLSQAMHIVAERDQMGEPALDDFWAETKDLIDIRGGIR